ncbi:MAG: 4'-phosphopantetheinyl transferase superfamily protein [Myxococcota bacterium]|nr:4'-phosphopantetheinyl transferase superfamily protein [Myxococcota bacterium]
MSVAWLSRSEEDLPANGAWLAPREAERAAGMRFTKRRNDFLLGRLTAKHAVARCLGLGEAPRDLAAIEIGNRERSRPDGGAPLVFVAGEPAPLEVSITDRAGWAICAVRSGSDPIGCDLEVVEPRSPAFVADYLTRGERAAVAAAGPAEHDRLANLLWSAKESALKVLRTGLRRDTRSVEVTLESGPPRDGWRALRLCVDAQRQLQGWWCQHGPFLLTVAAEALGPPPRSMEQPPSLAEARPTHTWLSEPTVSAAGQAASAPRTASAHENGER